MDEIEELKSAIRAQKKAENWVKCIELSRELIGLVKPSQFKQWYWARGNLALALTRAETGQHAQNVEEAIAIYSELLDKVTPREEPFKWANTQRNLGFCYDLRSAGQKTENTERAIEHLQNALEIFVPEEFPEDWAITKAALAVLYSTRKTGEPRENLKTGIRHLEESLKVMDRENFPEDWDEASEELESMRARLTALDKKKG